MKINKDGKTGKKKRKKSLFFFFFLLPVVYPVQVYLYFLLIEEKEKATLYKHSNVFV
jgi:hypothetical protein